MLKSFFRVSFFFFLIGNICFFIEAGCVLELPWCFEKAVQFVFIFSFFIYSCKFLHTVTGVNFAVVMFTCCLQYICLIVIFHPSWKLCRSKWSFQTEHFICLVFLVTVWLLKIIYNGDFWFKKRIRKWCFSTYK